MKSRTRHTSDATDLAATTRRRRTRHALLGCLLLALAGPTQAVPTISLDVASLVATPPENLFIDIVVSGLQSGGTAAVIGAWELDFIFDPGAFQFLAVPPAGFGQDLGNLAIGDAIDLTEPRTTPGVFHTGVLSLLEVNLATCVFCTGPFLEDLQGDSVRLATVGLFAPSGQPDFEVLPRIGIQNLVLVDGNGDRLRLAPEPSTLLLLAFGLLLTAGSALRRSRRGTPARMCMLASALVAIPLSNANADTVELNYTVRDLRASHPDFERNTTALDPGILELQVDGQGRPVYAGGPGGTVTTDGPTRFADWYFDFTGENLNARLSLLVDNAITPDPGVYTFDSSSFFPIDNTLHENEGRLHNYHFTAELHARFRYGGGEVLRFSSDDDLWVYINNQLVVDLGGIHEVESDSIDLDALAAGLGLSIGGEYDFDLFFAERQTVFSSLRFDLPTPVRSPVRQIAATGPGGGSLIFDARKDRQWLKPIDTVSHSYLDLTGPSHDCNPRCTTGLFKGWTFASFVDVDELFASAGMPSFVEFPDEDSFSRTGELVYDFIQLMEPTDGESALTRVEAFWLLFAITRTLEPLDPQFVASPGAFWVPCCGDVGSAFFPYGGPFEVGDKVPAWLYRIWPGLDVMPIGDSLTLGFRAPDGYRGLLREQLRAANFSFDYVGPVGVDPQDPFGDLAHESATGRTIDGIESLGSWQTYQPAITLLMAGTNDFLRGSLRDDAAGTACVLANGSAPSSEFAQRMQGLIDAIRPSTLDLFVASIPPIRRISDQGTIRCAQNLLDAEVNAYNDAVEALAASNTRPNVHFVDMDGAWNFADFDDGVHPKDVQGYAAVATRWRMAILDVLSSSPLPGDLDRDGVVSVNDIRKVLARRNSSVVGQDPRDVNGDGVINLRDARQLVLMCSKPRCQT